jgi:hypothetical protein
LITCVKFAFKFSSTSSLTSTSTSTLTSTLNSIQDVDSENNNIKKNSEQNNNNIDMQLVINLKSEIISFLESKNETPTSGKKNSTKSSQSAAINNNLKNTFDENSVTSEICNLLPLKIIRTCVAIFINFQNICKKKGYVLDLWNLSFNTNLNNNEKNEIISNFLSIKEIFFSIRNKNNDNFDVTLIEKNFARFFIELQVFFS